MVAQSKKGLAVPRGFPPDTLNYWVGVQQGQSYVMGRTSLAMVGHSFSDGVTIKMPYWVDVSYRPASQSIFSYWVS